MNIVSVPKPCPEPSLFARFVFACLLVISSVVAVQADSPKVSVNSDVASSSCNPNVNSRKTGNWLFLPTGHVYPVYLAGVYESRLGGIWNYDKRLNSILDATLGGSVPIIRYGGRNELWSEGFQIDFEGSARPRLDLKNSFEMYSTDYRAGIPITWGNQTWQFKTGFYHVSSHSADEFINRQFFAKKFVLPGKAYRYHYSRDSILLALAYRPHPDVRLYGELDYDFSKGSKDAVSTSFHFQFGAEYSAPYRPNQKFTPFAAANVILFEEIGYDASFCIQAGIQYRKENNSLFRVGLQYFYGVSDQYQNIQYWPKENKIGLGIWYDF